MKLIATLASGIATAAAGTCVLKKRGTSTNATYYKNFEASQAYTASPIALDSSGAAELYVNELVDVLAYDINGTLQLAFTAGDAAPTVEVISQSFTGTSYTDGSSGTNKPTTLQAVLDSWFTSAGSSDFNVLVGPTPTTIQLAVAGLSGLFFNVKTYGALGNGTADDTAGIVAAYAAAAATSTGAGTVFFPPGIYRYTTTITVPAGVKTLGSGGKASKLSLHNTSGSFAGFQYAGTGPITETDGIWFDTMTTNFAGDLVYVPVGASGSTHFEGCTFGGSSTTRGGLFHSDTTFTTGAQHFRGCYFEATGGVVPRWVSTVGPATYVDCDFVNSQTQGADHLGVVDKCIVMGCRFRAPLATSIGFNYIRGDFVLEGATVTGCYFGTAGTAGFALNCQSTTAVDFLESGNVFSPNNITPYGYLTQPSANASLSGGHASRDSSTYVVTSDAANVTLPASTNGLCVISRTAAGAQAITADSGRPGDRLTVAIYNNSGGILAPTRTVPLRTRVGYVANIANASTRMITFVWASNQLLNGTGLWLQDGVETDI